MHSTSLRTLKVLLGVVIAAFAMATVYISMVVVERQSALEQVSRYNVAWLVSQATVEYTRLEQRVSAFGLPGSELRADEVRLRFDIVANRLGLLQSGEVEEFVKSDPEHVATIEALAAALTKAEPLLERLSPSDAPKLLRILVPVDGRLARLAAAANRVGGERVAQDQRQLIQLHYSFSGLAAGLILCGIALIVLLAWHNRLLQRAHKDLKLAANDLQATADALSSAHQDVQDANEELERQNEVLVRRERELRMQNERFEAALNNMSQALCLVDTQQRLVVCNQQYEALFGFDRFLLKAGTPMRDLAEFLAGGEQAALHQVYVNQQALVRENRSASYFEELPDGRTIGVSHQPLNEGGWLATYQDLTESRRVEARIAHMAHHDALTNLPNRVFFLERVHAACERLSADELSFAVMLLDLDRFKTVNDTLGHPVGDDLLRAVADRLCGTVASGDVVARLGGDEFAVLLSDASEQHVSSCAEAILKAIGESFDVDGHCINIGTSVGIALAANGSTPDQLLKQADLALYQAKAQGRGKFCFFQEEMDLELRARRQLEIDLRLALAAGEFHLLYQPQVSLSTGEITGCEALLRWVHPTRGLISPAEFIPVAEEAGLISAIGDWVLRQACSAATSWPSHVRVAVNLSPAQFRSPHLAQAIMLSLAATGLAAERLELEITESLLLQDDEATLASLHQLRKLGVRIALDDFGTGYSSLSYLRRFPFDKIKIDQTFVREMTTDADCRSIIQSVIDLATNLRMKTTGEGVETLEQAEHLRAAGCTDVQGFFFHRPIPVSALDLLFRTSLSAATAA